MVENLGRGNVFVIVERVGDDVAGDWYVQVWLRDDNRCSDKIDQA
ncbi:hypothetical protein AB0M64_16105 [Streptomyces sp. NPDC051771]